MHHTDRHARFLAMLAAVAITALLPGGTAAASAIGFDNLLGGQMETAPITSRYAGFTWNNFGVLDTVLYTADVGPNGYANGLVSGRNVAFAEYGNPASFSTTHSFLLFSYAIGAAWDHGLTITVRGWNAGTLVGTDSFTVSAAGSIRRTPLWANVDTITFAASGGTDTRIYRGLGPEYYLDDIQVGPSVVSYDSNIPEPSGVWVVLAAICGFALLRAGMLRNRPVHCRRRPTT